MAEQRYVRVCPVCETENALEQARCVCGASLAGVDFSLAKPASSPVVEAAANVREATVAGEGDAIAESSVVVAPELTADSPPPTSHVPPTVESMSCPYADCAQANAPGATRCAYCNRLLRPAAGVQASRPLPTALRDDYAVVDAFAATGSEADLLLVADRRTGRQCVAKLYRKGLEPDMRLLDVLSRSSDAHVVRVIAHGVSDGVAYEVQEYLPGGTLRDMLRAAPLTRETVRAVVGEIAAALTAIHSQRILHRDLKPENVLVRATDPLALALTDFGIASLREATQHFTGGARTAKYAAPEALTGVIDEKSDWWALGMIALEAASGGHPFDGLTEQVVNHRLATQPVDVRGVYDDALRALCRGLLLRDPKRRWGGSEVARWLAGDETLAVPEDADETATAVRPYRIGATECSSLVELAGGFARHWEYAVKDLARGLVARWLEHELHDYDLVRKLHDLSEERGLSGDMRLLRFMLLAAPDMPPVWRGAPLGVAAILDAAHKAAADDDAAAMWLDSIAREGVLAQFAAAGHHDLDAIDRRWRAGWTHFVELWKAAQQAEEAWRKQPRAILGDDASAVASIDDLMFSSPAWLAPPAQLAVNGPLLIALDDAAYVDALGDEVGAGQAALAGRAPWYDALCKAVAGDPVGVLVAHQLLAPAREDAATERRREDGSHRARARVIAETRDQLRTRLDAIAHITSMRPGLDERAVVEVAEGLSGFLEACHRAATLGFAEAEYVSLCKAIDKLSQHAFAAQRALGRLEEVQGVNAIFMRPERLAIGGIALVATLALRTPVILFLGIVAGACFYGYRWYVAIEATEAALAALRLLRLHGKTLLRAEPEAGKSPAGAP